MNIAALTIAEARTEIERSQESCRRLRQAHPRAERLAEIADGITPLEVSDDCRRAVTTIRYHMARIEQLEEQVRLLNQAAASAAHRDACMREIA